jgi:hypothetical protein
MPFRKSFADAINLLFLIPLSHGAGEEKVSNPWPIASPKQRFFAI